MTVSTTKARNVKSGNGVTTTFPFDFVFFDSDTIVVTLVDADGVETVKTETTDYTVSGGDGETGSIETTSFTPASGESLVIERVEPFTQDVDLTERGSISSETLETRLDKTVMLTQRLLDLQNRSVLRPSTTDPSSDSLTVPEPVDGELLVGKSDGSGWENKTLSSLDGSALTTPVAVAKGGTGGTTASAARTNLGLGSAAVADLLDEDDLASDDAAAVPSQQSVKAYADRRRAYIITHTSDTALATRAAGGSQMGSTLSSLSIPASGFIRLTVLEAELDETGASADGRAGPALDVGGTKVWPESDSSDGTLQTFGYAISTGVAGRLIGAGFDGNSGDTKAAAFDIAANSFPTGSQDVKVFMGDELSGTTGAVTITGTTTTARFLLEIVEYTNG